MKKKRDIFAELTEGFDALKSQRESVHPLGQGQIMNTKHYPYRVTWSPEDGEQSACAPSCRL